MRKIAVLAVHPDDEVLGCGGTLLKHVKEGDEIYWIIATSLFKEDGFPLEIIDRRKMEIDRISKLYNFKKTFQLNLPTMRVDEFSFSDLISRISSVINEIKPEVLYLPFKNDVHSDHRKLFEAGYSCTKNFRYPFIKKVLMMETISETDFAVSSGGENFSPNVFVDISTEFKIKLESMKIYDSEISEHPFPRSLRNIEALATYRGSQAGTEYAESFMLLKEVL